MGMDDPPLRIKTKWLIFDCSLLSHRFVLFGQPVGTEPPETQKRKEENGGPRMARRLQVFSLHHAVSLITQLQTEQRNCSVKSPLVVFAWNDTLQGLISLWHMVAHR